MQTKGESLELPVYTELRPPGGATTNSVYTKTFRIKQAFICSLSKMQLDLKRFSSLLYNTAKAYFLPINRKLILQYHGIHGIDKTQSYGGLPGLSPTVQAVLDTISPSAGTGARSSTILQSSGNVRSCFGLVEGMAAT